MLHSLQPLTPTLWFAQSQYFFTNSGLFLSQGQAVLVDPCMRPEEIDAIARFVTQQDVRLLALVLTHSHWDHILGPERMPGVRVVAQAEYLAVVDQSGEEIVREISKWEERAKIERQAPFAIPRPDETFEREHPLAVGGLRLRLVHAPGHARDQLVIYDGQSGTLWSSDILSNVEIPFVSHSLAAYERTLAELAGWDVSVLVPGHGHPSADPAEIRARLADDRAYLAELRERVSQAVRQGKPAAEAVALCARMRFRNPQDNAAPHQLNVESAYLELGGEGDAKRIGWNKDWSLQEGD